MVKPRAAAVVQMAHPTTWQCPTSSRRTLRACHAWRSRVLAHNAGCTSLTLARCAMGDSITANAGVVKVDGLPITFSCFSRPGNDPMKRSKENQDSMTVIPNYGSPDQMFIAVFDGHGPNGAQASQFVRSVLPQVCGILSPCVLLAMVNAESSPSSLWYGSECFATSWPRSHSCRCAKAVCRRTRR